MNVKKVGKVVADPKFFPRFFRSKKWLKGPFVIPEDEKKRRAMYCKLEKWSHYCILLMPGYEELRRVLFERLELLNPPPKKGIDIEVPQYLLNKEWRDGNFIFPPDPELRKEAREKLEPYENASLLYQPQHRQLHEVLRCRLKGLRACDGIPA